MRQVDGYPLWLGNAGDLRHPSSMLEVGIEAVVELAVNEAPATLPRDIVHCRFPLVDGGGNPQWLIRSAVGTLATLLQAAVPTLVCCGAGMSRSPAIAAAAVAFDAGCSATEALTRVTEGAPADISPALWAEIQAAIA